MIQNSHKSVDDGGGINTIITDLSCADKIANITAVISCGN